MIVLGIETATPQVGAALGDNDGVMASLHLAKDRRHTENLAPSIKFLCERVRIQLKEVNVVAVDIGPGLFTGLRVGVSTGKAMALALGVPMIGLSSLDLLAFPARWSNRPIVSVIDGRRGEVFYAIYRQVPGGVQRVVEPKLGTAEELAAELLVLNENCLLVGDGAIRYADVFASMGNVEIGNPSQAFPTAASLVELAHPRYLREEFVQPWEISPMYLRQTDAAINWQAKNDPGTFGQGEVI